MISSASSSPSLWTMCSIMSHHHILMLWSSTSSFATVGGNKYLSLWHLNTSIDVRFWKPWIPCGTFFHKYLKLHKQFTLKVFNSASTAILWWSLLSFYPSRSNTTSSLSKSSFESPNEISFKLGCHKMVLDEKNLWEMGVESGKDPAVCWTFVILSIPKVSILLTWWIQ